MISLVAEHHEIKRLVYEADTSTASTKAGSSNYDTILAKAVNAFIEHAKEEEDGILPRMSANLSPEEKDVSSSSKT
jgi:hypothetical protein